MRKWMLLWLGCWAGMAFAGPGLVGTWSGTAEGAPLTVTFAADGTGSANGEPITWQLMGGLLFVAQYGEVAAYQVRQEGDALSIAGGAFAAPVTLRRGAAAAVGSQSATPAPPATGQAKAGGGQELVGKWCKGGAFSAVAGGGSSSMGCFELKADGSYTYEYEGSVSAYGSGMYGATASQSADRGNWQFAGDTLTARSVSGQIARYALQKRNHPKTGDPMLCLDGDCYVTYWQKAPW